MTFTNLRDASPDHLTARLYELRGRERELLVELLRYMAEVDRRRLYLDMAFPSFFAFATDYLGYSKAAAFRRTTAARLLARFPAVGDRLADGRLTLTTLVELREVLTEERADEILARADGRTEEEVKLLVAALQPRPAPPDLFRLLPTPAPAPTAGVCSGPEPSTPRPAPPRIEPISEQLRVLRITVGADFTRDLEAARDALSHQIPNRDLVAVLHECLRVTLAVHDKRRRGTGRRGTPRGGRRSRYVPSAIRDAVFRRDEGRCAFVASDGRRCDATHQLELHHVVPYARGGASTVEGLALRCKAHNLHEARRDFGDRHMDLFAPGA